MLILMKKKVVPKLNLKVNLHSNPVSQRNRIIPSDPISGAQTARIYDKHTKRKNHGVESYLCTSEDFFIKILKKLEKFEFTVNINRILTCETKDYQIELAKDLFEKDFLEKNHKEFVQKCGNDCFLMIITIFSMYKSQISGLQKKDLLSMIKDFEILKKIQIKSSEIEVLFSKYAIKKILSLKGLIEVFYQLNKQQNNKKNKDFKIFFKEVMQPKYNEYRLRLSELNIEKIFVFNKNQNQLDENMILQLIIDLKDCINHVFIFFKIGFIMKIIVFLKKIFFFLKIGF